MKMMVVFTRARQGGAVAILLPIMAFVLSTATAQAQIMPFHGTLTYSTATGEWPTLAVKTANGSRASTNSPLTSMSKTTGNRHWMRNMNRMRRPTPNFATPALRCLARWEEIIG